MAKQVSLHERFCTQSAAAGLTTARCGNFRLQLTTSLASWWKSEVGSREALQRSVSDRARGDAVSC